VLRSFKGEGSVTIQYNTNGIVRTDNPSGPQFAFLCRRENGTLPNGRRLPFLMPLKRELGNKKLTFYFL
jgi:hypothetical protein